LLEIFDEAVRRNYDELIDTAWVVGFLGFLGMVVTCMGLLGMAMYTAETRAKEVGLRKIMGASVNNLAMMLSKGYLVVLGIAVLIAVPLSLLLGNLVLQEFAQRIGWTPLLFVPGVLLLLAVASLTIGSQTVRAALANPVKSLRSE
jgi:putative ABC transport system permease protein